MISKNRKGESHGIKFYTDTMIPNGSKSLLMLEDLKKEKLLKNLGANLVENVRASLDGWEDGLYSIDWVIQEIMSAIEVYKYEAEDITRVFNGLPTKLEESNQRDIKLAKEMERLSKLLDENEEKQKKILEELRN